ncbi:VOC family protein [Brevibacillus marinus]|uniref:VOC family protein n=1 Tax=Brevibacillus marinus TaxID=2496837 RepID=UPI000F81E0C6|nr:VOC family protein [Brevibacillus marinus]
MKLSMGYVILYVKDHERSLRFYRDLLGLHVRAEHGTYVEFDTGSTILAINTRDSVRELTSLDIPEEQQHSQTFEIGFVVDDVDVVIETLRASGVKIIQEPVKKPWGQTVAYIADPDGHFIEICTPIG